MAIDILNLIPRIRTAGAFLLAQPRPISGALPQTVREVLPHTAFRCSINRGFSDYALVLRAYPWPHGIARPTH
jgi:hypothetical protein